MIYLDNAATSRFKPKEVYKAVLEELNKASNSGRGGHKDSVSASMRIYNARLAVANSLNVLDSEVIFTSGCTEALNLALLGLNLYGHIITTCYEHNSVLRCLKVLEQRSKITLTILEPNIEGKIPISSFKNAINKDTKLIAVNYISNVTGSLQDVEDIGNLCTKNGILFLVDAAQAYGHINIDVKNLGIDFLAAPSHKGINGIQGCGFLIARDKERLSPIKFGGTGTRSESLTQPNDKPEGFESGTLNSVGIVALGAAIDYTYRNFHKINSHLLKLNDELFYGLKNINGIKLYTQEKHNVYSFNIKNLNSSSVSDILSDEYNIATRSGLHCAPLIHKHLNTINTGAVRASLGYNNTKKDIDNLLYALEKIVKNNYK